MTVESPAAKSIESNFSPGLIPGNKKSSRKNFFGVRTLDFYLLKTFIPPFIVIFFITLFVLIMQFLWVYVDDLVGKGLSFFVIAQLLFFASASLVPLALPLAVLLASMMTMGNLAEHYELTSLKSSGLSLLRVVRSLLLLSILLCGAALAFANYALPVANLKFGSLLYDIRQQRPALNIKQGVFYNEIDGYSILVGKKDADNRTLHNVMIYDHTRGKGDDYVITAETGKMYLTQDKRYMVLQLYRGHQYQELNPTARPGKKYEQTRTSFREWRKTFDLSAFALSRTDERLFKEDYKMQNLRQLKFSIDTVKMEIASNSRQAKIFTRPFYTFIRTNLDSINKHSNPSDSVVQRSAVDSFTIINKALNSARNVKGYVEYTAKTQESKIGVLRRFEIEWERKFVLSFACFVLFLIGVSLGAIIRIGGFGLPFVISVFFFIIFYVLSIAGEKMAKEGALSPFWGMWFSTVILFPLAIYLMYKANRDSALLNSEAYIIFFKKLFRRKEIIEREVL
ncbi:MAG TPA: LptF/LptG family permease [Chitinophagales bacterium]|nr:LptF/LptG family permease [Chitinophagales bacterium]